MIVRLHAPDARMILSLFWRRAQVIVYVDGVRVGVAAAAEETPHHIIHRLCELDLAVSDLAQPPAQKGVGFRLRLPGLQQGKHEVGGGNSCTSALGRRLCTSNGP